MKFLLLTLLSTAFVGCAETSYNTDVYTFNSLRYNSGSQNIESFLTPNKFPNPNNYDKVALICQTVHNKAFDLGVNQIKQTAKKFGADAILIISFNEIDSATIQKLHLPNELIPKIATKEQVNHYTKVSVRKITALAIKYKPRNFILNATSQAGR